MAATAIAIVRLRNLFAVVMLSGLYSLLSAAIFVILDAGTWQRAPVFDWLQEKGNVAANEMYRTFNCGIGMTILVEAADADTALAHLNAEQLNASIIGRITEGKGNPEVTIENG